MKDKVIDYTCFHIASIKSTAENKTSIFFSPFLISTSWFLILVERSRTIT